MRLVCTLAKGIPFVAVVGLLTGCADRNLGTDMILTPPSLAGIRGAACTQEALPDLSLHTRPTDLTNGMSSENGDTFDAAALSDGRKVACFLAYGNPPKGEAILRGVYRGDCNWPNNNPSGEGCPVCHPSQVGTLVLWRCVFSYTAEEEACRVNRLAMEWRGTRDYVHGIPGNEYAPDKHKQMAPEVVFNPAGCKTFIK